ncbi:MAG: hypothetical protein WA737_15340 [Candidatus Acidiferrales bacterium]
MRSTQAILLVLALLAAPVALLARASFAGGMSACNGMCCAARGHRGHAINASVPTDATEANMCHHSAASQAEPCECAMRGNPASPEIAFFVPMAPTAPIPAAELVAPALLRQFVLPERTAPRHGFSSVPFEPPRS